MTVTLWETLGRDQLVLAVDASTYVGTVAVLRGGAVVSERETAMRGVHEERLMPAVVAALEAAGVGSGRVRGAVGAVVCGGGPGSFTSLRIASAIAKGLAASANAPLYAAPSLALAVAGAAPALALGRYVAILDAMRGEWYAADVALMAGGVASYDYLGVMAVDRAAVVAGERGARLIAPPTPAALPADVVADRAPHARGVVSLGGLLATWGPVDLNTWEPEYGRKAEAQVKWELAHARTLPVAGRA